MVTEAIRKACEDVGAVGEGFVKEEDVVRFVFWLLLLFFLDRLDERVGD